MNNICPKCKSEKIMGIEDPMVYDGIHEWFCQVCETRWGRWSNRILKDGEHEKKWGV